MKTAAARVSVLGLACSLTLALSLGITADLLGAAAEKKSREQIRAERKVIQDEVMRVDKELNDALLRADVATLGRLLTKDFVEHHEKEVLLWDGRQGKPTTQSAPARQRTKEELLGALKAGTLKYSSLQLSNVEVAVINNNALLGDRAILMGRLIEKSTFKGQETGGEFLLSRTYVKSDGKWVCLVANLNPLVSK